MKVLSNFALTALFAVFAMAANASTTHASAIQYGGEEELKKEIATKLNDAGVDLSTSKAKITFAVDSQNKLILLKVKTKDANLDKVIKKKLHRKELDTVLAKNKRQYTVRLDQLHKKVVF